MRDSSRDTRPAPAVVTLQHADHSPAGATAEVTVRIDKGAQPSTSATDDSGGKYGGPGY